MQQSSSTLRENLQVDVNSTYIHDPPFFKGMNKELEPFEAIKDAYVLCNFGDSITTDHISPAGKISKTSPAAKFLNGKGVQVKDFSSYGARRDTDGFCLLPMIVTSSVHSLILLSEGFCMKFL